MFCGSVAEMMNRAALMMQFWSAGQVWKGSPRCSSKAAGMSQPPGARGFRITLGAFPLPPTTAMASRAFDLAPVVAFAFAAWTGAPGRPELRGGVQSPHDRGQYWRTMCQPKACSSQLPCAAACAHTWPWEILRNLSLSSTQFGSPASSAGSASGGGAGSASPCLARSRASCCAWRSAAVMSPRPWLGRLDLAPPRLWGARARSSAGDASGGEAGSAARARRARVLLASKEARPQMSYSVSAR
mmetsp:Transcript_20368/g.60101  ORF Transcript_20368/g.60101 Transcript_20368/m.60101 type:complete len:243 (+) Transcript_20368:849-1577(+)